MPHSSNAKLGFVLLSAAVLAFGTGIVFTQTPNDVLVRSFQDPPDSARPRVWWHWMNGNVSKEGIKADLEWFKRAGIAGFQNFDAGLNTPQVVAKRLIFMTPEWKDAFKYAATLADQLGLEMAIAGSPGWSESGGPWVTPAQAMKKYVWSETRIEGGRRFAGILPKPPSATGPYQNQGGARGGFGRGGAAAPAPEFYADAAVVAFRAPASDRTLAELQARVASSGGEFSLDVLTDGDLSKSQILPAAPAGEKAWIQVEFPRPQSVQGLTFITGGGARGFGGRGAAGTLPALEASDDGRDFRPVASIPGGARTIAFPAVTARFFRVAILTPTPPAGARGGAPQAAPSPPAAPAGIPIAELVLHPSGTVNRFQEKTAFAAAAGIYDMATPAVAAAEAVPKAEVFDLTGLMKSDGRLSWAPPAGRWIVLRIGYSLTGARNSPASPEATGLEVDKLSPTHVKAYWDNYLGQYKDTVGDLMGKHGLQYIITDSWEAGVANWTNNMIPEFRRRRGYDMKPWLPVLAGRVVESAEASDRFLWDFRKTLGEMTAEYHYDQLTTLLKARGMGRYTESHESGRAFIGDGMEVKRSADVPMSAMWTSQPGRTQGGHDADVRESASVAHIYGQNLVAAESLTAGSYAWAYSPETLKPTADRLLAMGLNRFVIHTSVHQPLDDKVPGLGLGPFGQWFTRHETWAESARPWTTYLARSSYLLQQGTFAADILYYYGEDSNVTALFGAGLPDLPAGYAFDFVNSDALLHKITAAGGALTTASGMRYRLLVLDPNARHMPLAVLKKLRDIVKAGVAVVGPRPVDSPSLADNQADVQALVRELWGTEGAPGKIDAARTPGQALAALGLAPDFDYAKPREDTSLMFVHRRVPDGELYWVSNAGDAAQDLEATFRVQGKAPEIWHADTGAMEPAAYRIDGGRTVVPLALTPHDAVFVVFRKPAAAASRTVPVPAESVLASVTGAWDVAFQAGRGAPPTARFDALGSWSDNPDPGIKYFSGSAVYTKTLQAPEEWFMPEADLWLDLGDVKNIAEVTVNGKNLGILWRAPFRVSASAALKPGINRLEIKLTNLWVNRLIGDQQPGVEKKITYTAQTFYRADAPLLPSGLLGPVRVLRIG
jgi:hypothetical protein